MQEWMFWAVMIWVASIRRELAKEKWERFYFLCFIFFFTVMAFIKL